MQLRKLLALVVVSGALMFGSASLVSAAPGCTYSQASNFDPTATSDDGSCTFDLVGSANQLQTNLFYGVALFFVSAGFWVWFLRGKRV